MLRTLFEKTDVILENAEKIGKLTEELAKEKESLAAHRVEFAAISQRVLFSAAVCRDCDRTMGAFRGGQRGNASRAFLKQ